GAAGKSVAMPIYHRLGEIPHKRHSVFRKSDGSRNEEELMGNKGFTGPSSLLYHFYQPTRIKSLRHVTDLKWEADPSPQTQLRHFKTAGLPPTASAVLDRIPLLFNNDLGALFAQPQAEDDFFYRNGQGDELIYVSDGEGVLETQFGDLPFRRGDYLVIPRGVVHRYHYTAQPVRFLIPPPVHQTFEGDNFVVCSFCPRPFDFDPQAIPVPYNHSNVMSDEAIYYASSEFMSRKGIEYGSLTLHPDGFSHGPHPGKAEESLHQEETREVAVMFDTFHPLRVAKPALAIEDRDYYRSWIAD